MEPQAVEEYLARTDVQITEKRALLASQEAEAAKLSATLDDLLELFHARALSRDEFGERNAPLSARRDQIRQDIPRLHGELDALLISRVSTDHVVREARDLHTHWPNLTPEEKRRIVETLCDRITVAKGDIEINLGFRPIQPQPETATERQRTNRGSWRGGVADAPGG